MRIVILTGNELRHKYVRKIMAISERYRVLRTYCESADKGLRSQVESREETGNERQLQHVLEREESEKLFFQKAVQQLEDYSNPSLIEKGDINQQKYVDEIMALAPDVIAAYGCSIIKPPLLKAFPGKVVNVHLGLSPYYRGTGTNFWPFVNGEPEYVGATFMYMNEGIDTGSIIHQIRASVLPSDNVHSVGNRLIKDMAYVYRDLLEEFKNLETMKQIPVPVQERVYRKKDFGEKALVELHDKIKNGLFEKYSQNIEARCLAAPIIQNPAMIRRQEN